MDSTKKPSGRTDTRPSGRVDTRQPSGRIDGGRPGDSQRLAMTGGPGGSGGSGPGPGKIGTLAALTILLALIVWGLSRGPGGQAADEPAGMAGTAHQTGTDAGPPVSSSTGALAVRPAKVDPKAGADGETWEAVRQRIRDRMKKPREPRVARRLASTPKSEKAEGEGISPEEYAVLETKIEGEVARQGYFHTLPTEKQEALLGKINELTHEVTYHPENIGLRVELARAQKEAHLRELANQTLHRAHEAAPENVAVISEIARDYHAYGFRRRAEVFYEKWIALEPGNETPRQELTTLQERFDYHPGWGPDRKVETLPASP